jgi:hypothetical protein
VWSQGNCLIKNLTHFQGEMEHGINLPGSHYSENIQLKF